MERISKDTPASDKWGHEFRYHLAAGFLELGDVVLDAACGIGYGADILAGRGGIKYIGVDKDTSECPESESEAFKFIQNDLTRYTPDFKYDMFVGFETIEHLVDYKHYIYVAKNAVRVIVMSVPVVPTKHVNEYHLHDFKDGDLACLIEDESWYRFQVVGQPSEFSEIVVFKRR